MWKCVHICDSTIAYMNTQAPSISPLFRSDMQGQMLAHLFLNPDRGFTVAELARLTGSAYASVHREVSRVVKAGWVSRVRVGQASVVQADTSSWVFAPLVMLLAQSYGPVSVIPRLLSTISGITSAEIYGSWAELRWGSGAGVPQDVDVLVVGNPDRGLLDEAAREAESVLGKDVNIRVVSEGLWNESDDVVITSLRSTPRVPLIWEGASWSQDGSRGGQHSTA